MNDTNNIADKDDSIDKEYIEKVRKIFGELTILEKGIDDFVSWRIYSCRNIWNYGGITKTNVGTIIKRTMDKIKTTKINKNGK